MACAACSGVSFPMHTPSLILSAMISSSPRAFSSFCAWPKSGALFRLGLRALLRRHGSQASLLHIVADRLFGGAHLRLLLLRQRRLRRDPLLNKEFHRYAGKPCADCIHPTLTHSLAKIKFILS